MDQNESKTCPNCRRPLPANPLMDRGEEVCDFICATGRENGRKMREIVELNKKWSAIFRELGLA